MTRVEKFAMSVVCLLIIFCIGVGGVPWWVGVAALVAMASIIFEMV